MHRLTDYSVHVHIHVVVCVCTLCVLGKLNPSFCEHCCGQVFFLLHNYSKNKHGQTHIQRVTLLFLVIYPLEEHTRNIPRSIYIYFRALLIGIF